MKRLIVVVGLSLIAVAGCGESGQAPGTPSGDAATADRGASAARWVDSEFQPSTLTREEQLAELAWFAEAAAAFSGMRISVVSETLTTHEYEATVLARAFEEITGIEVTHDLIQEGDVIEKLQTQMQSGQSVYDGYVNDSDLIGTHADTAMWCRCRTS